MELDFEKLPNGKLRPLRLFRPYFNQEESIRSLVIYNPEGGPDYGLYGQTQNPLCSDNYKQWSNGTGLTIRYPKQKSYR